MNTALKRLGLILSLAVLAAAPLGATPLRADAHAARWQVYDRETVVDSTTGQSYIIFGNVRHLVSDPQVLTTLGLSYSSAPRWTSTEVNTLPQGDPLTLRMVNGQLSQLSPIAAGSATLTLSTSTVGRDGNFSVTGTGYAANESVEVVFDYGSTTHWVHADGNGQFSTSFSVANNTASGTLRVFAYGSTSKILEVEPIQVTAQPAQTQFSDGTLIRDTSNGKIYVVWNGVRHWITDAKVYAALGFNFSSTSYQDQSSQVVSSLPEGDAITFRMSGSQIFPLSPLQSGSGVVWLSLPSASPGNSIQLSGSNFGHYEHVTISFAGSSNTVQTDQNGNFSATITVSGSATIGSILDVYIFGQNSHLFVVEPLNVISPAAPAQATAQASTFQQGQNGQVTGSGFAPNEPVVIFLAQNAAVVTANADGNGNVNATVPVPSSLSTGSHSLVLYGTTSKRAANIQVTILPASGPAVLNLDHQSVTPGAQVMLSGSGYRPGESITIRINGQSVQTANADGNGQFNNVALTVPANTPTGFYTVTATGNSSGNTGTAKLNVVAFNASLQLAGGSQVAGGTVWFNGHGFFNGEIVTFTLDGQSIATNPGKVYASSNGDFSVALALPSTLSAGAHTLVATGVTSHASASVTLQVQGQNPPPPPPSQSHVWYFPRANTHTNYRTVYYLTNYQAFSVQVNFTFMLGNFNPTNYSLWLPAHGRTSLDLRSVIGSYHDAFAVVAAQYNIRVQEVVYHYNRDSYSTYGVNGPRNSWYFGNANNSYGQTEVLIVANPNSQTANLQIQFRARNGRTVYHSLSLVPNGFLTLTVKSYFPDVPRGRHSIYLQTTNGVSFIAKVVQG